MNRRPCSCSFSPQVLLCRVAEAQVKDAKEPQAPPDGGHHNHWWQKSDYGEEQKPEYWNVLTLLSCVNKVSMNMPIKWDFSLRQRWFSWLKSDIMVGNHLTWHVVLLPGGSDKGWPLWCPDSWRRTEELTEETRGELNYSSGAETYEGKQIKLSYRVVH